MPGSVLGSGYTSVNKMTATLVISFFLGGRQTIDNIYILPDMNRGRGGRMAGKLIPVSWSGKTPRKEDI